MQDMLIKNMAIKEGFDEFLKYSHFVIFCKYQTLKVKYWITLNEPSVFSDAGYDYCEMAPGECGGASNGRMARHITVLAHAEAYHIYDDEFR